MLLWRRRRDNLRTPGRGDSIGERQLTLLGVGIYTRAEAARLLHLTPGRVSSWVRGYRYSWGPKHRRRRGAQPPVIRTDIPVIDGTLAISFLELMELRVVKHFREQGIPLQTVRVAWQHAAQAFQTKHPFADRRVFVDEARIFMALDDQPAVPDVLEISSRKQPFQVIAGPFFARSLREAEFDERTQLVRRWWPRGRDVPIVLDPRIAFGAPVIAGTRIRTDILALYAESRRPQLVARAFGLDFEQVRAAINFESQLARAA